MRKYIPALAALGSLAVIALVAAIYWSQPQAPAPAEGAGEAAIAPDPAAQAALGEDEMVIGNANAPITIIEYASLTCGHCGRFHNETLPTLKTKYIDTGLARLVYRDFPLDPLAMRAAMLAHCTGKQRYFGFLEVLFRNQAKWTTAADPVAALAETARIAGLGQADFERCVADEDLFKRLREGRAEAERTYRIQSTPTFIINGKKFVGARSFEEFDGILRQFLPGS